MEDLIDGRPIAGFRVVELKAELEKRGQSKTGTKKELVDRLKAFLKNEREADSTRSEEAEQSDFVKEYLKKQQESLQEQKEAKRQIEEQERRESESSDLNSPTTQRSADEGDGERVSRSTRRTRQTSETADDGSPTPTRSSRSKAAAEFAKAEVESPVAIVGATITAGEKEPRPKEGDEECEKSQDVSAKSSEPLASEQPASTGLEEEPAAQEPQVSSTSEKVEEEEGAGKKELPVDDKDSKREKDIEKERRRKEKKEKKDRDRDDERKSEKKDPKDKKKDKKDKHHEKHHEHRERHDRKKDRHDRHEKRGEEGNDERHHHKHHREEEAVEEDVPQEKEEVSRTKKDSESGGEVVSTTSGQAESDQGKCASGAAEEPAGGDVLDLMGGEMLEFESELDHGTKDRQGKPESSQKDEKDAEDKKSRKDEVDSGRRRSSDEEGRKERRRHRSKEKKEERSKEKKEEKRERKKHDEEKVEERKKDEDGKKEDRKEEAAAPVRKMRTLNRFRSSDPPSASGGTAEDAEKEDDDDGGKAKKRKKWGGSATASSGMPALNSSGETAIDTDALEQLMISGEVDSTKQDEVVLDDNDLIPTSTTQDEVQVGSTAMEVEEEEMSKKKELTAEKKKEGKDEGGEKKKKERRRSSDRNEKKEKSNRDIERERKSGTVSRNRYNSGPIRPEGNGTETVIQLQDLTRPFTMGQLMELLNSAAKPKEGRFWINKLRSKCLVEYDNYEDALTSRNVLDNMVWPVGNPKAIRASLRNKESLDYFLEEAEKEKREEEEANKRARMGIEGRRVTAGRRSPGRERVVLNGRRGASPIQITRTLRRSERSLSRERALRGIADGRGGRAPSPLMPRNDGGLLGKRMTPLDETLSQARRDERDKPLFVDRKRQRTQSPPITADPEAIAAPGKLLDELFFKSKTQPCIYWLPLTPGQITAKEAARQQRLNEKKGGSRDRGRPKRIDDLP
ncbi:unnamed protein product [Cyprideis torosa]|uniref:Uncharacterized protein n=1 Tax=Cyprideis torosa TaxID=163714 RepID=A0A7R8W8L2_9CRUS|nr:unnamed protein product [Cyprideis torosa]CAG0883946.1 unnamed protein product [Cyprideis torosa]